MLNIRKFIISLTFIAALGFITQSCFDGLNDFTYQGPPVVEFSNLTHENASWVSVGSFWATTIEGDVADAPLQVALVGPHQAQPKEIGCGRQGVPRHRCQQAHPGAARPRRVGAAGNNGRKCRLLTA